MSRKFLPLLVLILVAALFQTSAVHAATDGFSPGNIIDDSVMTNKSSMTPDQIQLFLNSKVPVCDTWGQKMYTSTKTRAQYAASLGYSTPFTCLKDYISSDGRSGARIIYDAAQKWGINPQVLIVLLQKEQGLITDDWPWSNQYRSATGYGCPDTAPCDSQYYGLENQLDWAAKLFRKVINQDPYWYSTYSVGSNFVLWSPNSVCGGNTITIQNWSTAALYDYTPYQPNQAALNAGYGMGDSCSAYGNRNFFLYFTDWFGSTRGTPFFKFPGEAGTYIYGANNSYYYIRSYDRLLDYGFATLFNYRVTTITRDSVSGLTFKGDLPGMARFGGDGVYIVNQGRLVNFPDATTYYAYGYNFGDEASLPAWLASYLPNQGSMQQVVKLTDSDTIYFMQSGKKRPFCSWNAFTQLGSPSYGSQPSTLMNSSFMSQYSNGAALATDGELLRDNSTGMTGVMKDGALVKLDDTAVANLNLPLCNVPASSFSSIPVTAGVLKNTVQDETGQRYILDNGSKLVVSNDVLTATGLSTTAFSATSSSFTNRISSKAFPPQKIVRVNQQDGVFKIMDGVTRAITTPADLSALNYSFSDVRSVSPQTFALIKSSSPIFPTGTVLRIGNQDAVYLVTSPTTLQSFPTSSIFLDFGYTWSSVRSVSSSDISAYSITGNVQRFSQDSSGRIWFVSNKARFATDINLLSSQYYAIASTSLTPLTLTTSTYAPPATQTMSAVIRMGNTDTVYLVSNGQKRPYGSGAAFLRDHQWSEVVSVSADFINGIPPGNIIN